MLRILDSDLLESVVSRRLQSFTVAAWPPPSPSGDMASALRFPCGLLVCCDSICKAQNTSHDGFQSLGVVKRAENVELVMERIGLWMVEERWCLEVDATNKAAGQVEASQFGQATMGRVLKPDPLQV
jgi:hypothetical protein